MLKAVAYAGMLEHGSSYVSYTRDEYEAECAEEIKVFTQNTGYPLQYLINYNKQIKINGIRIQEKMTEYVDIEYPAQYPLNRFGSQFGKIAHVIKCSQTEMHYHFSTDLLGINIGEERDRIRNEHTTDPAR